jgi:hypothetical protein
VGRGLLSRYLPALWAVLWVCARGSVVAELEHTDAVLVSDMVTRQGQLGVYCAFSFSLPLAVKHGEAPSTHEAARPVYFNWDIL